MYIQHIAECCKVPFVSRGPIWLLTLKINLGHSDLYFTVQWFFFYFFALKNMLLLLAKGDSGELRYSPATALILVLFTQGSIKIACSSAAIGVQMIYVGCIIDQFNWSGPFSRVVIAPDFESEGHGFKPRSGHSTGNISLHVYFSSYCKIN